MTEHRTTRRVAGFLPLSWRLACLLMLAAASGCSTVGTRQAILMDEQEPFERALMAYVRGELDVAGEHLELALREDPHDARAWELLRALRAEEAGDTAQIGTEPPPPAVPMPMGPSELMRVVRTRNPELRKAVYQVVEARARLREANLSISPELTLLARIYPLGFFTSLTQNLYGGIQKRKALMSEAEQMMVEAVGGYAKAKNAIMARALLSYIDLRDGEEAMRQRREWKPLQQEAVRIATVQGDFASVLPDEPLEQKVRLAETEQRLHEAAAKVTLAKVTLNGLMGRAISAPITLRPVDFSSELPANVYRMVELAREQRYDFRQSGARVARARAHKQSVRTSMPDLDARASYGQRDTDTTDSFQDGPAVSANLRMPVMLLPIRRAQLDREDAIIRQLELDQALLASQMAEDVAEAYGELEVTRARLVTSIQRAESAAETFRIADVSDRWAADTDPLTLMVRRVKWMQAQQSVTASGFDAQRALVNLHRAMGTDMERLAAQAEAGGPGNTHISLGRAMWVWRTEFMSSVMQSDYFLDFARAHRVSVLFLFFSESMRRDTPALRGFLRRAHERGIMVHALNGEPDWSRKEGRERASAFIEAVKVFNLNADHAARLDAVHLDVEPYALPAWDAPASNDAKQALLDEYVDFVAWAAGRLGDALPLFVDVPPWYGDRRRGEPSVIERIRTYVDGMVLMAYAGKAGRIVESVESVLAEIAVDGRSPRVWVGISADPAHSCRSTGEEFEDLLREVEAGVRAHAQVAGVAIHEADRYRRLVTSGASRSQISRARCGDMADAGAAPELHDEVRPLLNQLSSRLVGLPAAADFRHGTLIGAEDAL